MSEFFQEAPQLGNQYDDDRVLRSWLEWRLPADLHAALEPGLAALGARAAGDALDLANAAEAQPPRLVQYDAWGRRIDRIVMAPAWHALHAIAAEEGIVATAYERREGRWFALARCYAAVLLIEIASARAHQADAREHVETALRWCAQDLAPLPDLSRAGVPGIAAGRV